LVLSFVVSPQQHSVEQLVPSKEKSHSNNLLQKEMVETEGVIFTVVTPRHVSDTANFLQSHHRAIGAAGIPTLENDADVAASGRSNENEDGGGGAVAAAAINGDDGDIPSSAYACRYYHLICHQPGVLWRALLPILMAARRNDPAATNEQQGDEDLARRMIRCMWRSRENAHLSSPRLLDGKQRTRATSHAHSNFIIDSNHHHETDTIRDVVGNNHDDTNKEHTKRNEDSGDGEADADADTSAVVIADDHDANSTTSRSLRQRAYQFTVKIPFRLLRQGRSVKQPRSRTVDRSHGNREEGTRASERSHDDNANANQLQKKKAHAVFILMFPTTIPTIDTTFISALIRMEHAMLKLQSLSAYAATLGGGFFFCRRLAFSLQLARYQRSLAMVLGQTGMVRACTINEAYNLIFLGRFRAARRVLKRLFHETCDGVDDLVQKQCRAAWLLSRRLERVSQNLEEYQHFHPNHPMNGSNGSISVKGGRKYQDEEGKEQHDPILAGLMTLRFRKSGGERRRDVLDVGADVGGDDEGSVLFSDTIDDYQRIRIVRQ